MRGGALRCARTGLRNGAHWPRAADPIVDTLMGGRYWPAVMASFNHLYGLNGQDGGAPFSPDGVEDFGKWRQRQKRRS